MLNALRIFQAAKNDFKYHIFLERRSRAECPERYGWIDTERLNRLEVCACGRGLRVGDFHVRRVESIASRWSVWVYHNFRGAPAMESHIVFARKPSYLYKCVLKAYIAVVCHDPN